MSNTELNMDVDSILDGTLDDLADVPEFKPFPIGTHRLTMNFNVKKIGENVGVELKLTAIETIELPSGSEETPLNKGDSTSMLFFLKHSNPMVVEMGQGQFKQIMSKCAEKFGANTNRALMEAANNSEILAVTGRRYKNKGKPEQRSFTTLDGFEFV